MFDNLKKYQTIAQYIYEKLKRINISVINVFIKWYKIKII